MPIRRDYGSSGNN